MKTSFLFFGCLSIVLLACQASQDGENSNLADIFPAKRTQILVVGSIHFNYPGADIHEIAETNKMDVLSEPKKSEVLELVQYINRFKPTKIAIEAYPSWNSSDKLKKFKEGEYSDQRDERFQLAMRIAIDNKIDTLYPIDSRNLAQEIEEKDSLFSSELWQDTDFSSNDPQQKYFSLWFDELDKSIQSTSLLEAYKLLNKRETHQKNFGAYLVGDFKVASERGPDVLSVWWYNRNLRIFRKIQKISTNPEDRILVIIGNGHAAVLRQLLECSSEFDFVEFDSL